MKKYYTRLLLVLATFFGMTANAVVATAENAPLASADIPDGYYYIKTKCATYSATPYVSVAGDATSLSLLASPSDGSVWKIEKTTSVKDASHVVYAIQSCHNTKYWGYGPSVVLQTAVHNNGNGDYYLTYTEGKGYAINTEFNSGCVQPTGTSSFNRQGSDDTKYYDLVPVTSHSYTFAADEPVFLRLARNAQYSVGGFISADETTLTMEGSAPNLSTANAVWKFVGDDTNGYKVTNVGTGKVLGLVLSTATTNSGKGATLGMYDADETSDDVCILWDKSTSSNMVDGFYLGAHGYSSYRINDNGGFHLWTGGAGAGSTFRIYKAVDISVATVGENAYSTAYYPFALALQEGTSAYTAQMSADGNKANLTAVSDGVVPANAGVILEAASGTPQVTLTLTSEAGTATSGLTGTLTALSEMEETATQNYLVLGTKSGVLGFYLPKVGGTIAANKAYFDITGNGDAVKGLTLNFNDATTGIETLTPATSAAGSAACYDITGRKVLRTTKGGMYIQNGKKFIAQ